MSDAALTTDRPLMVSMHNPLWDRKHDMKTSRDFRSVAVPCIGVVIGLLLLLMLAIVVTRVCRRQKRVQTYTYAQLTAELSASSA